MNSSELKGFLTGLILGDGTIDKGVNMRAFAIKSTNKDFIDMIESEINNCSGFKTKVKYTPEHYSCGCNHRESWEFRIEAHTYFVKMYHHFYDDNRHRRVSGKTLKWLTPRGLANWYMSDGYICLVGKTKGRIYNRRVDICTDRYTLVDIKKMQKALHDRFDVNTSIIKHGKYYRLRIKMDSYESFFNLIYPYLVPSMLYKAYLGYEQQPEWMSDEFWSIQESLKSANPLQASA